MARKRKNANTRESALGLQGRTTASAQDMFSNMAARTGFGTLSLGEGAHYPLVRTTFDYWQLITLYESHWIARRIVDAPAEDMIRAWPRITSDIAPKELTRIDRAVRRTNMKRTLLTTMEWARLFGGAGALIVIEGQDNELDKPLDLDSVPLGGFKGLLPFDRWAGITPDTNVSTDMRRPLDFNLPESYNVRASGGRSFNVHASRILRFTGPLVPTPEREAYSFWGISVIEPVIQEIKKRDNVSWNILELTFRANILGMKFPDLAQLLSGINSSQAASLRFEQRMSQLNHMISNQSLVPLPADGSIESTQYSFSGLSECYQQFCLDISGAAQIPVARLWGRTISGLGQTGDGDERIYEERIATDQDSHLRPQLEKLFPVICMSELGEVPDDLDLVFPSIRVLDEKEKSELAKTVMDTVVVALNAGIMSPRTAAKEIKQSSDITGIGTNITDEDLEKLSDKVSSEGELGEGLFGAEGSSDPLEPTESPDRVLKEEDKNAQGGVKPVPVGNAQDAALYTTKECGDLVQRGNCSRCGDYISTHCDASNNAIQCQDCGKWFGNCCCMSDDPLGNRCNKCLKVRKRARTKDEKEFNEADHPRQDDGKFRKGTSKAQLKAYKSREEWPAHIKALKVPPAWTDVKVADDPNAPLQATGKDAKGRSQAIYSAKFSETQAALKFDRVSSLAKDMPLVDSQLAKLRASGDEKLRAHGDCMTLVRAMGIRPGGDDDTKAKVKAYGASTLEGRHIVTDGKETRLKFIGKKGVPIDLVVEDPAIAKNLRERAKSAGANGRVFPGVSGGSLLATAHSLDHGGYKTKDFRTNLATDTASKLVKSMPVPKDEKQYKKQALEVAKAVSARLGNTPTVALQSYIAPQVFAAWRQAYA